MSKVAIVTDSTAYIPQDMLKRYPITVLPQTLIWGEETFRDGVDIQPVEFYTRLAKATVMPSTSRLPNRGSWTLAWIMARAPNPRATINVNGKAWTAVK